LRPPTYFLLGNCRGVSPIVSVLLMVGVALALGGFVSLYMTSYVTSSSRIVSLSVSDALLLKNGDHVYLAITLRNTGSTPVNIGKVTIYLPSGSQSSDPLNIPLSPGQSYTITEEDLANHGCVLNASDFNVGSSYVIRVYTSSGGSQTSYTVSVLCQG